MCFGKGVLKKEDELQNMPDISMQTEDANIEILNFDGVLDENKESTSNEILSKSEKILQTTAEVISGLSEKVELHATYYLSECYVQNNQEVKQGEIILKYTNGTYLVAPYDCIITELSTASNGKFTITAQFENDESVKLGMSSSVEI